MMIQASKHSVINAILLGRSGWRQNALATNLQHLFQKVTVFAEAHLGFLRVFSITALHVAIRARRTVCSTASLRSATVLDLPLYICDFR